MAKILNASLDVTLGGENASNEVISSQKAIKTYVDTNVGDLSDLETSSKTNLVSSINEIKTSISTPISYYVSNPALTPVEGICSWQITHNLGSMYVFSVAYDDENNEIFKNTTVNNENQITISFSADSTVEAGAYRAVVTTGGIGTGGGTSSNNNDMVLQMLDDTISGNYATLPTTYTSVESSLDSIIDG